MTSTLKVNTLTGVSTAGSIAVTGEGNSPTTNLQQGLAKGFAAFNQKQIENYYEPGGNFARTNTGIKPNFEEKLINDTELIPKSPDYIEYNIEKRVNLGNPGKRCRL